MSIIKLENVKKYYTLGKTEVSAIKGVSFDIDGGELK